jgi:hypothetical protein
MKKLDILKKLESLKGKIRLFILVIELPNGGLETITNYQNLYEKMDYIVEAYDNDLKLKNNPNIQIIDFILL